MTTGGIVLCGGESTRMGRHKAWLPLAGEFMLPRLVRLVGAVVSPVVVVAAAGQDLPPLPADVAVVHDDERGRGPLQGLAAGLKALQGRADAAYATSCDVPFLRPGFIRRLIELRGSSAVCVPYAGDRFHPLAAVYRLDVLSAIQKLLAEDRLRLGLLLDLVPMRIVNAAELADVDPALQSLRNLNTPEDYQAALSEVLP